MYEIKILFNAMFSMCLAHKNAKIFEPENNTFKRIPLDTTFISMKKYTKRPNR